MFAELDPGAREQDGAGVIDVSAISQMFANLTLACGNGTMRTSLTPASFHSFHWMRHRRPPAPAPQRSGPRRSLMR